MAMATFCQTWHKEIPKLGSRCEGLGAKRPRRTAMGQYEQLQYEMSRMSIDQDGDLRD